MARNSQRKGRRLKADDPESWAAPVVAGLVACALLWVFVIAPIINWIQENAILVTIIVLLASGIGGYLGYQKYKEKLARAQSLPGRIISAIKKFEPSRKYRNEFGYHTELQGWLKREFPSAKVELQTGASRPDIIVDNVAIEVKGPTDGRALKTLGDKCMRYLQYYEGLVVVMFEPSYTRRLYKEVEAGIHGMWAGRAWLIEK